MFIRASQTFRAADPSCSSMLLLKESIRSKSKPAAMPAMPSTFHSCMVPFVCKTGCPRPFAITAVDVMPTGRSPPNVSNTFTSSACSGDASGIQRPPLLAKLPGPAAPAWIFYPASLTMDRTRMTRAILCSRSVAGSPAENRHPLLQALALILPDPTSILAFLPESKPIPYIIFNAGLNCN